MKSRWSVEVDPELDAYQIYSCVIPRGPRLVAVNVFASDGRLVVNLLFEDEACLYPILFAELDLEKRKILVPPCAAELVTPDEAKTVGKKLKEERRRLGEHATVQLLEENSFVGNLLRSLAEKYNLHRTPYCGLADIRTQKRTFLLYRQAAVWLQGKAKSVLDLGCGSGYGSLLLARAGFEVWGIDIDELPISFAQRLGAEKPAVFMRCSAEKLLASGQKFDAVLAIEVLEHVDDPETFLDRLLHLLRPEGRIVVSLPTWKYHGIDLNSDHRTNWTFAKAEKFFRKFFRIEGTWSIKFASSAQRYSIDQGGTDQESIEHLLVAGRCSGAPGFNPWPSSVLLVCHNIPPYENSGVPLVTWRYAEELKRLGYRVGVLIPGAASGGEKPAVEEREGVLLYRVPPVPYPNAFLEAPFSAGREHLASLEAVFTHFRPDVVHVFDYVHLPPHLLQMASDFGAIVIRHVCNAEEICLRGSPVVAHRADRLCDGPNDVFACAQCLLSAAPEKNELFRIREESLLAAKIRAWTEYVRFLYRTVVDGVIFPSAAFKDYFAPRLGLPADKTWVVPHGVVVFPQGLPRGDQARGNRIVFAYLGAIDFCKGVDVLAQAFKEIPPEQVELRVYGKIYDRGLYRQLTEVPCVRYMGEYTPTDIGEILADVDVGVVPSYFETYPLVLRELLSHGVPVVATRFFGSEIVRDGENGFLVEIGDAQGLREKAKVLMEDKDLLRRLKEGARSTLLPAIREEVDAVHAIYRELHQRKYGARTECNVHRAEPVASVIIPVFNNWQYTRRCLNSLEAAGYRDWVEVIAVDNASTDETPVQLKSDFPWVKVIRNQQNLGFAVACNIGAAAATGQYLVFLNNDTEVKQGWLEALISACREEGDKVIVGSKLLYPDGSIQHAGVQIDYASPFPVTPKHLCYRQPDSIDDRRKEVDAVSGASMLVPRVLFYELGGFEEVYQNGYEDVDFCLRARQKGYRVIYEPASKAIHYESKTPGRFAREERNLNVLHRRWLPYVLRHYRKQASRQEVEALSRPPVSIIIVTYNSLVSIAPCLESVLSTTSDADEIIVVDNCSRDETAYYVNCLREVAGVDRIKLHAEETNLGYARAAALGAEAAQHDYLIFLNPDTVVYSGWVEGLLEPLLASEKIAASGPVSNYAAGKQNVIWYLPDKGIAKKASAPELARILREGHQGKLIPTNLLIGFCLAVKRGVYEELEGFDKELFLGNDDLDFSWRLARAGYEQVVVPSVFVYHKGQESFNTEPDIKTRYLVQQSTNQLYEKLYAAYNGYPPDGRTLWGIEWFLPQEDLLSIIMPVYRGASVTKKALEALAKHTSRPYEVIVVDNGGDEETGRVLEEIKPAFGSRLKVIRCRENLGYPLACNRGLAEASGNYLVVMNNDVVVTPHWASRLMAAFTVDPSVGIVGPRTNYCAGIQQVSGCKYGEDTLDQWAGEWYLDHAGSLFATNRLIGFLWMMKRELLEEIGGFDPLFGIGNFEDDDYCLRAQLAGYRLAVAEDVFVHHYGSHSFRKQPEAYARLLKTNRLLFQGKWELEFKDGSYNPEEVLRRAWSREELFVPLDFSAIFSPQVEPLNLGGENKPFRFLCIPDPSDEEDSWLKLAKEFLTSPVAYKEASLIIWVEPPLKSWLVEVLSRLQYLARREGIDLENSQADIVIEARRLPSCQRGRVYRAATHFVSLPGVRQAATSREARACGLEILELEEALQRLKGWRV